MNGAVVSNGFLRSHFPAQQKKSRVAVLISGTGKARLLLTIGLQSSPYCHHSHRQVRRASGSQSALTRVWDKIKIEDVKKMVKEKLKTGRTNWWLVWPPSTWEAVEADS